MQQPFIPRAFCGCGTEMRCIKNGYVIDVHNGFGSYYKISSDLYDCPACHSKMALPAEKAIAMHFDTYYESLPTDMEAKLR